jgi:serine/threonine-protein kinase
VRYDDILENYPDAEEIGRGGQKVVFVVDHPNRGHCVLKIGQFQSQRTLERIRREFSVLTSLNSPYFPRVYSMEVFNDQRFVVLEQALPGIPLTEKLTEFQEPERALGLITDLVDALSLLWDRRVIHRDVKPANILIGEDDQVFVIDLGIPRLLDEVSLTHTLAARGPCTPVYAAPEQLTNRKHEINHRCDQFAIGIVLTQLLLGGRHPFDPQVVGEGDHVVYNILDGKWAFNEVECSPGSCFLPILQKILATEPHCRYRTPQMLITALNSV